MAQASASSGESKPTKNPSPVVTTSLPLYSEKEARSASSCHWRSVCQASSPSTSARLVEPTMSVNMKVLTTRRGAIGGSEPHRHDLVHFRDVNGPGSDQENAASQK